jgi:histidinol-phosphate aminotransferase
MNEKNAVSRRKFVGGVAVGGAAAALGYVTLKDSRLFASAPPEAIQQGATAASQAAGASALDTYDSYAKLSFNENPYGPPESVMQAMNNAFKYANRYGYPDGGILSEIAKHHGVDTNNILLGAGSGEILEVVGAAFLEGRKKVVGSDPSFNAVYDHATSIKADVIKIPLLRDFSQNIPAMVEATRDNYRDVGFVYLCNPNNPTGKIVPRREVLQLLDALPEDMPVLIDEAYHHFVEDRNYATSVPAVLEGRPVIIARTFSKISALAGMRLGYAVARRDLIAKMRPYSTGTINALVKWGGVAALKDVEAQDRVRKLNTELRGKTVSELRRLGYDVIPSEGNFFMVHIKRSVQPVIQEFQKRNVLVGRPFPPMLEHLRVSVGTAEEMDRFMVAWKEIFTTVG